MALVKDGAPASLPPLVLSFYDRDGGIRNAVVKTQYSAAEVIVRPSAYFKIIRDGPDLETQSKQWFIVSSSEGKKIQIKSLCPSGNKMDFVRWGNGPRGNVFHLWTAKAPPDALVSGTMVIQYLADGKPGELLLDLRVMRADGGN